MVLKMKKIISILLVFAVMFGLCLAAKEVFNEKTVVINEENINSEQFSNDLLPGEAMVVSANNEYTYKFKNDREVIRSKAAEILRLIINDSASSEDAKKEAEEQILKMADNINKEAQIESLLNAKGFEGAVVFISDSSVSVTVAAKKLSNEEIAKINDIVYEISGNNNVKIVEVN